MGLKAESGFTIMEVLIAMAIFAIGILGIATMQISATQGNTTARKASEASEFTQQMVETTMAISYSSLAPGTTTTVSNGYTATRVIANALDAGGNALAGIFEITVTVNDPSGVQRSSLRFLKTNM